MTCVSVLCAGNASGSSWCGCRWCGLCCEPAREIWHWRQSCFWGIIWEQSNSSSVCSQGVRYTHATTPHHSHLHRLVHVPVSGELLTPLCSIHPGKFVKKFCPDTVSFFVSKCGENILIQIEWFKNLNLCVIWFYKIVVCNFSVTFTDAFFSQFSVWRQFVLSDCYVTDRIRVVEGVEQDMGLICVVNDLHVYTINAVIGHNV